MTPDDEYIEGVVRAELEEGRTSLERSGSQGTFISMHRHPRTDRMLFQIGGRYPALPDRDIYATVDVDPAREGWRLEANLWEYPDSDDHDHEVSNLGGARVESPESAAERGRILAGAAWLALQDHVSRRGQPESG